MNFKNKKMHSLTFGTFGFVKRQNKKAQGLSLSTVVIAALVLIVLIVLTLVFAGKLGSWNKTVDSCPPESTEEASCAIGTLPVKILSKSDGSTVYCCPKTSTTSTT